jgi:hypothetical protein
MSPLMIRHITDALQLLFPRATAFGLTRCFTVQTTQLAYANDLIPPLWTAPQTTNPKVESSTRLPQYHSRTFAKDRNFEVVLHIAGDFLQELESCRITIEIPIYCNLYIRRG